MRRFLQLMCGVFLVVHLLLLPFPVLAADKAATTVAAVEGAGQGQREAILAHLSDEDVRKLLLEELQAKDAASSSGKAPVRIGLIGWLQSWLHLIDDQGEEGDQGFSGFLAGVPKAPGDLVHTLAKIGGQQGFGGFIFSVLLAALVLGIGYGAEKVSVRLTDRLGSQTIALEEGAELGSGRIWGALLKILPSAIRLTVFAITTLGLFVVTHQGQEQAVRALFLAIFLTIVFVRTINLLAALLLSPDQSRLRLLPLENSMAVMVSRGISILSWYIVSGLMFIAMIIDLGSQDKTRQVVGLLLGTILILLIAILLLRKKMQISAAILEDEEPGEASWLRKQFAAAWHVLALLYLFGVWLIWLNTLISGTGTDNGALLISLMIVPIYLLLDRVARWLVGTLLYTLNILPAQAVPGELDAHAREMRIKMQLHRALRIFIALVLILWMLSLWGYSIPFAMEVVNASFDILVTLTLALFVWRMTSRFIESKLAEAYGQDEETAADDGEEFGSAPQRGRDYTLLPMLRKFIATTLLVMVTLIVLSSIGVDIGPLLAGAGVIGLAVGFGAQKLVSDVLSGIFYLLDDAFRVGEYIQAGSVSGTVEAIALRNVMLRHHRGMLQIVPHSDLGSITNFMRGGIIVKFNLEFPYDTDVDAVRKVIKKVGQKMLEDPELGPDFIQPLKSQGVREIANSVMVIRVKFTAHPGKQFVIQREGFRLITEALAAKGIHYAHRKVIVEVPTPEGGEASRSGDQIKRAVEAGAAAGVIGLEGKPDQEQQAADGPMGM